MQLSNIPAVVPLPFANSGTKNTIPTASQIGITPGAASLTDGFPPLTFTPIASGGVPPYGADFNGILNLITAVQRWQSGGGLFTYNSGWSTQNGGYPKGALLLKADGSGYWQSLVDNNTSNPDTGGANWQSALGGYLRNAVGTYNADANGLGRVFFGSSDTTRTRGYGSSPIQFANGSDVLVGAFSSAGILSSGADAVSSSDVPRYGQLNSRPGHTYTTNDWAYLDKTSGLIIQWGVNTAEPTSSTNYNYPTAFTTQYFFGGAQQTSAVSGDNFVREINISLSSFRLDTSTASSHPAEWFAVGI